MASMKISYESLDIALMLWSCFVIGSLEFGVADEGLAMFAPILRLQIDSQH